MQALLCFMLSLSVNCPSIMSKYISKCIPWFRWVFLMVFLIVWPFCCIPRDSVKQEETPPQRHFKGSMAHKSMLNPSGIQCTSTTYSASSTTCYRPWQVTVALQYHEAEIVGPSATCYCYPRMPDKPGPLPVWLQRKSVHLQPYRGGELHCSCSWSSWSTGTKRRARRWRKKRTKRTKWKNWCAGAEGWKRCSWAEGASGTERRRRKQRSERRTKKHADNRGVWSNHWNPEGHALHQRSVCIISGYLL